MKTEVEIKTTPKELAKLLFDLDNEEVAEVFSNWKKLFEDEVNERRKNNETIWIWDLNHFMMHVVKRLDDDGIDFFRSAYSSILYRFCDDITKKHLIKIQ